MVLTSRTLLFILFCVLTAAAIEGFNGGVIQKRLQLFKNAANHVRTITFPVGVKQHGMRRDCHPTCHGHHRHDHQKHDHHHSHGHHHKHGHHKLSFGRAIYQDPYYHVSPQLFYFNKKPLNHGFNEYYSNKFSPYWFTRYNYLPYHMKPLLPTYNYHLKPLYYYLRNPQILAPVQQGTWIKPHENNFYPIDNQVSSEDSLSVADPPNNPINHNVYDSSYEENVMTNAQIPVQDSDLDTENNQSNENDNATSITDLVAEETNTTSLENNIHNVITNGDSTSYNNAELTTHQNTPMIGLDELNESSTPGVRITVSFDNDKEDTTAPNDLNRIYTTKSYDSFNFGGSGSSRTTVPSYKEKNTGNFYSTNAPIAVTDSLEHEVTIIGNEPSLKDDNEQTMTYSPQEIFHDQTTEISPERGQLADLEDSMSLITGFDDENSDGGLKYETSGGTTIPEFFSSKLNDYHTSTTSIYDVTSKIVTEKNKDLLNYDQTLTTIESPKNDDVKEHKGSPILQTLPQPHFEQQTTMDSHFSDEASTFFLEPKDRYYTTTDSPKKDELREYEDSPTLQTITQNRFEESTTISPNFNDDASSETLDQELLLFEEFIKTILESKTAPPEISYSELFQSKTGIEIDELNERTTVSSFIEDAIDSSVNELSTMDNWRSTTISPAQTSITGSELIPDSNVYRDLEDESSLKTTVSSNSLENTAPVPKELDESLKDHTSPVTSSSISTDFDRDYDEAAAEKSNLIKPSIFTDFTGDSENEFSKSTAQIATTFSPPSIYTDSTENPKVRLSEFKFESNSIPTTPSSVYNDFTGNYLLSTPSSLKIEIPDSSTNNINFDKASSDNLDDEILENGIGNIGHGDKFDSVEVTTNHYNTKENWNVAENKNNNISKATEDEVLVNEKNSITEAWNKRISIDEISEITTLSAYESKPLETDGIEFREIENENSSISKIEETEKQNNSDNNIATEKNSLIPEDSSYVTEKYSENFNNNLNYVTSKSDPIDSVAFQAIQPTTIYHEKMEQTPVSSLESDFGNMRIGSIDKFSISTTPTLETFDSFTVEDRELNTSESNNNIQDMENFATIFENHGNNKIGADLVFTTEPSYVTDLNNVGKQSNSKNDIETPTTETPPVYFHGNLFEEIKNVIINKTVPSDYDYLEVTDANLLYDTTSLFRTDQYEQTTIQPNKLHSQNSIDELNAGKVDSENISREVEATKSWFAENKNNTDHDDQLLRLESSSEANFNSKTDISSEKLDVQGETSIKNDEDTENEAKDEESHLNELNLSQNIRQDEKNMHSTSPSNYSSLVENNIDETTLSSEAGTKLNADLSNQENEEGKVGVVFGQTVSNETVDDQNTSKVINEIQSNVDDYSDGVIRIYEDLDTSFPSSEIALKNQNYNKPEAVNEKPHVSEEFEPVTEKREQDVEEKTTEIFHLKQFQEPLFIENLNETENQAAGIVAKNYSIDEANGVESTTRAQLSDFTEIESIVVENKDEEIVSPNSNSANDNTQFHLDLLNPNGTFHDNSKKELSNKSSMIEEVTYYNIKDLEENSNGDNLIVAVNDEETNRTGLLSVDELINVNNDDLTNNYELIRSVRYEYSPYYIVSESTLNVRNPYSNKMKYQNDRSAKPRYIVKRDVMKANASQIPLKSEEFITEKREIKTSSYQGEEANDDDEDYDYNNYEPSPIANPSDLIEVESDEEDDTKVTKGFGPSIMELFDLKRRLRKQ